MIGIADIVENGNKRCKTMNDEHTKLESIHSALQELQQDFNIPDDHEHLEIAFKFIEDLREAHFRKVQD